MDAAIGNSQEMVLAGVSTDCCVLSTALAAADAGVHVRVVSDACAGVSDEDHERALAAMEMYQPMIEITTTSDVLVALAVGYLGVLLLERRTIAGQEALADAEQVSR